MAKKLGRDRENARQAVQESPSEQKIVPAPGPMLSASLPFGCLVAIPFLALASLYLYWIAWTLRVDYYDAYDILNNARAILTHNPEWYTPLRSVLLPIALMPVIAIGKGIGTPYFAFISSHLLAVTLTLLFLWTSYRLARFHFNRSNACWVVVFLALNPLLIHLAPAIKEAIPGALFTALAFYFYLRSLKRNKQYTQWLSGLFIAAAMLTRYNLIPVLFPVIALHGILCGFFPTPFIKSQPGVSTGRLPEKIFIFFVLPSILFFLIPTILYTAMGWATLIEAPRMFITGLFSHQALGESESALENYAFLIKAFNWPFIVIAVVGLLVSWRKRQTSAIFFSIWFVVFFLFHTYFIGDKIARLLVPMLMPFCFLGIWGMTWLVGILLKAVKSSGSGTYLGLIIILPFLALSGKDGIAEYLKFQDPVYTSDFHGKVSRYAARLADENKIFWMGPFYAVNPKDYVFHPKDESAYIYHFHRNAFYYYTDRSLITPEPTTLVPMGNGPVVETMPQENREAYTFPKIGSIVSDGDVIIVNSEVKFYTEANMPKTRRPLTVERVKTLTFEAVSDDAGEVTFSSRNIPGAIIKGKGIPGGCWFVAAGIPDGDYHLYLNLKDTEEPRDISVIKVQSGEFSVKTSEIKQIANISNAVLLSFDVVKKYSIPQ